MWRFKFHCSLFLVLVFTFLFLFSDFINDFCFCFQFLFFIFGFSTVHFFLFLCGNRCWFWNWCGASASPRPLMRSSADRSRRLDGSTCFLPLPHSLPSVLHNLCGSFVIICCPLGASSNCNCPLELHMVFFFLSFLPRNLIKCSRSEGCRREDT